MNFQPMRLYHKKMKLCIVQKNINDTNYVEILDDLKEIGTDIVLFGELATTGCLYNGAGNREIDSVQTLFEIFQDYPFAVMIGLPRVENGKIYNSYINFEKPGYQIYDKINLFEPMNETDYYTRGDNPVLFDIGSQKFGVSICYDIRFPKLYDRLKETGADIIVIPAAFPRARISAWKSLLVERAVQTNLPIIGINAVGDDGTNEFGGSSMVIAPDGSIIAQADEINETIIEVEL